jgi:hypothetical protein
MTYSPLSIATILALFLYLVNPFGLDLFDDEGWLGWVGKIAATIIALAIFSK